MKGWKNMSAKAKRRRFFICAVEQLLVAAFLIAGYLAFAGIGELLCRLFGVGA